MAHKFVDKVISFIVYLFVNWSKVQWLYNKADDAFYEHGSCSFSDETKNK